LTKQCLSQSICGENLKEPNKELFFVQVREPNEVRKYILQTLKEIVEILHRFEKFRQIRHEKIANIHKLRALLKDANKMLGSLKLKLPQTNLRAAAVKEITKHSKKPAHKKKVKPSEEKPEKAPKREMTETEKLEAQLNAIESKLKSLT